MTIAEELEVRGWARIPFDAEILRWVKAARPLVDAALCDAAHAQWHRYGGTWFVGVHALPNDTAGTLGGTPFPVSLSAAVQAVTGLDHPAWDRGQISICFPGYPQPAANESEAAHRFRVNRDAAHVDGLHREGPERRRYLREFHRFILGVPVDTVAPGMSPFVVWEGSHRRFQAMFRDTLADLPPSAWGDADLTGIYQATRHEIFDTCARVEITAHPGEAYLVHRFALHGMAPWAAPGSAGARRAIIYFRPETDDKEAWLMRP